jgi:predicted exporter
VVSLAAIGYTATLFNVFNVMALLLILGVGIDYALFYERAEAAGQATTALAISMAAATTLLAFGLLIFSGNPVVRAFGTTLAPGVLAAYGLALLLTGRGARRAHER